MLAMFSTLSSLCCLLQSQKLNYNNNKKKTLLFPYFIYICICIGSWLVLFHYLVFIFIFIISLSKELITECIFYKEMFLIKIPDPVAKCISMENIKQHTFVSSSFPSSQFIQFTNAIFFHSI